MTLQCDRTLIRGGATPHSFDGAGSITLATNARKLVGMIVSNSLSARTADEGTCPVIRLDSSNWPGNLDFQAGWIMSSETAANAAPSPSSYEIVPLDIPVTGDTVINVNVTEAGGATQTGTHDVTVGFLYDVGGTPGDILSKIPGIVGLRGAGYGYKAANAATTEAALSSISIPGWARELVAIKAIQTTDGAVTADEEFGGYIRLDTGLSAAGAKQNYPLTGGCPQDGTDVDTGNHPIVDWIPMHIPLPAGTVTVTPYVNAASAITGGAGIVVCLAWR